jgi:hypothetical protein
MVIAIIAIIRSSFIDFYLSDKHHTNLLIHKCNQRRVPSAQFRLPLRGGRVETRRQSGERGGERRGEIGVRRDEGGGGRVLGLEEMKIT